MFTSTLPRAWADPVRRTVVWITVVATIAWSIGLSFLINVPTARAAVTVNTAPTNAGITGYKTDLRNTNALTVASFQLSITTAENFGALGYIINSVAGVLTAEMDNVVVYGNSASCTGVALTGNASFKACGTDTSATVGMADSVTLDADNNAGNGTQTVALSTAPSTWLLVVEPSTSGDTLDNTDAFTVLLGTNAIVTSVSSPTITAFTTDTFTFTTAAADATAPTPTTGGPPDGQTGAPADALIDRSFSEALVSSRVNTTNVTLKQCTGADQSATTSAGAASTACATVGNNLCATVALDPSTRITCTPTSSLAVGRWHEFRIGTGVIDAAGNAITEAIYRFKTNDFSGGTNTTVPRIMSTFPSPGATGIPPSVRMTLEFPIGPEGNMKTGAATVGSVENHTHFTLQAVDASTHMEAGTDLCGASGCTLSWDSSTRRLVIDPTDLTSGTEYVLNVSGLLNSADQPLQPFPPLRFTAGATDSTAPTLRTNSPTVPAAGATSVTPYTSEVTVSFSENINPSTLSLTTLRLCQDSTAGSAGCEVGDTRLTDVAKFAFRYESLDRTAHLSLLTSDALSTNTKYCIEIVGGGSGVKDSAGNALAATSSANCFTTGAAIDPVAGGPKLLFADADNFKLVAHFSEGVKDGNGANGAENATNYTFECPVGVTVNLTGKTIVYAPENNEVEIQGLGLQPDQSCRLTVAATLQDFAGNAFDTSGDNEVANFTVLNNTTTGGFLGTGGVQSNDFFGGGGGTAATFWEKPQRCQPRNSATNKVTTLECEFPAPAALATGSTFTLMFPSGFTMTDGTNNTRAIATTSSFMNADINGPAANAVTIDAAADTGGFTDGVSVDTGAKTVIVKTSGAIASGDMIHFELDRLTTPTTPQNDLRIQIIVKGADGVKVGQTIQPSPFPINQAGSLSISGRVCKGTSSGGACAGGDTGINGVKVMCTQMGGFTTSTGGASGMMGFQDTTTATVDGVVGSWSITGLTDGQYGCNIPPDPTTLADLGGSPPFQMITLAGASKSGVDTKYTDLSTTGKVLTITVSGLNDADADADDFDVFCHAGFSSYEFSAPVMKAVDAATAGNTTTTVRLQGGKTYECGMGPHIAFASFGTGAPPPPPTFDFMPPKPLQVVVPTDANPAGITFNVTAANLTINATVVDGSANGIANVFVHAAPVGCFDATTGDQKDCFGSFGQTNSSGLAALKVGPGTYEIGADGPGLPPSTREIVTITSGTSTVTLRMVKSSTTISGQILDESGNGIKYAHVNGERRTVTSGTDACDFANSRPAGGWADSPTDESGNFTLYAAAGTWCIRAFAPSYGEVGTKTVTVSGTTSQSGQNIQATSTNFGTITGTVTKGGTATGGGFINCFSSGVGGNGAPTNSDGTYKLKVKLPTTGTATYTCDGFMPGVGNLGRQTTTLGGATTTATVNFTAGNPGTITVTIANITDAFCDARDSSGFGSPAGRASSAGVYTINVTAGVYTVRCGGPKYGPITLTPSSVTVTAGDTATVTGTAPTTRTVTGRVTDGTSNVAGATLTFTDSTGKSFNTTTGSQSGTNTNLSLTGVPEGTYTLTASKKSFEATSTTATVSGGNLTLSSPIALSPMAAENGDDVKIRVQESATNYTGDAKVIATKGGKTIVAEVDETTGIATAELTNGTWTVQAVGDNGKQSTSTTITVTSGDAVSPESVGNYDKTLSLANSISGYTAKNESETLGLSAGGLLKYEGLAVGSGSSAKTPEINVPASTLSTSDSSNGSIAMASDPTLAGIDPGTDANFVGSYGYDITPKDANGNAITDRMTGSVTITMPYTDADVSSAGVDESKLQFASYNTSSQAWETVPTTVDTENNLLIATVSHFSSFGIIGSEGGGAPTTSDATPPAAVGNPAGSATANAVTLTWTDPSDSDLDSVEVLRNNPPSTAVSGVPLSRVAKGTQRFVDSGVSASTAYTYILRARDRSGNSRNSGEIKVTTPAAAGAPPAPAVVTAPPATTTTAPAITTPAAPAAPTTPGATAIGLNAGDLVKSPSARTVYLVGADGKRYVYPNEVTYKSWHADFSNVKSITDGQMAQLMLGGTVTVRPGTWLVKIESDPKVYAIEPGGTLRWVETETRAQLLYGTNWNRQIIDVPVSYWPAYREGGALGSDRHPTGTVVRSGGQTYYIDAGRKRLVATDVFSSQGFQDRFVRALSSSLVYEDGPALSSAANLKFASR